MSSHPALHAPAATVPLSALLSQVIEIGSDPAHTVNEMAQQAEAGAKRQLRWTPAAPAAPADLVRLLMDAGWMPRIHTQGDTLLIDVECCFGPTPQDTGAARFSVIVAASDEAGPVHHADDSPGLREVDARIVTCRGADGPAQALAGALPHCDAAWVLLCSPKAYFPTGFGHRLNAMLDAVPVDERRHALIGLAGVAVNATGQGYAPAGFVVEGPHRADHPASEAAVSLDEIAVVIARDSIHRPDPAFGHTLWATDLALAAISEHQRFAHIVRLPLFHDTDGAAPDPAALHDAATRLLAKYPAFGPIPTLQGLIDGDFVASIAPAAQPGAVDLAPENPLFQSLDEVCTDIDLALAEDRTDDGMSALVNGVHRHFCQPGVAHNALYYPGLDRRMETLATLLAAGRPMTQPLPPGETTVILATELYNLGGHSKVVEDISRELSHPVIVLTDLFLNFHKDRNQFDWLYERYGHAAVIVLPGQSLWSKAQTLHDLLRGLRPRNILYFNHHQDPLPFVAALASQPEARQVLFHHCDHNPSLGCTVAGVQHVDFTTSLQATCTAHLDQPSQRLPLYVPDQGVRPRPRVRGQHFSVVTSGRPGKFARTGPLALQAIIATSLTAIRGQFFHIGPLDEAWLAEIRAHLGTQGLAPGRFVHLGLVPSVWRQLAELDAAFYIGSAPVSGGRAGIEAQGCGYPVLPFNGFEAGSLLADFSSYADEALGWSSLTELGQRLRSLAPRQAELSAQARAFYERCFSREVFRRALGEIIDL